MSRKTLNEFYLPPVAAALLLAYGRVYAEENPDVHDLVTPESFVSIGVGTVNNALDAKRFAQYTGLNQSASALLDVEVNRRDNASGLWTIFNGSNLGQETRELSFSQNKQGDWKYLLDYNEIVRRDPYVIHTGMTGIGSATPTVNLIATPPMPTAWAAVNSLAASNGVQGSDVELKLKRTALGVSGSKWLTPELQFELSFRNEDKKGARMFGRAGLNSSDMQATPAGGVGGWAVLLTPEPIDSTTQQIEAKLNFNRDKLALTGGYYGSFYVNNVGSLSPIVPNTLNRGILNPAVGLSSTVQQLASSAVALPPDNQAHQLYLGGNYAFSQTTHGNFKLSYTHATQNESFAAQGLTPSATAPASLGGVVDTTLAQFGLSMKPVKDMSLTASLRYEDRADKTPVFVYNYGTTVVGTAGSALNGTTNWPSASQTRTSAKLEGTYRLAAGYSTTLGVDWESKNVPLPPVNSAIVKNAVFFRSQLDEYGVHGELRKTLAETLSGAIGFEYKQRRGGSWFTSSGTAGNAIVPALGTVSSTLADMYMDRNRTKLRGTLDWSPLDRFSLQTVLEHTQDDYLRDATVPTALVTPGARVIVADSLTLDSSYTISDDWRLNGYWTRSENKWNVNKATTIAEDTQNFTDTVGLGIKGKPTGRLEVGADILATHDTTNFTNTTTAVTAGWVGQPLPGNYLPSIHYVTEKLNLFAKYAIEKHADVQMNLGYQHFSTDDWQWGYNGIPFLYSDNTTVSQPMNQHLLFVAARYIYKF